MNPHEFLNNEDHLTSLASPSRAAHVRFLRAAAPREGIFPARSLRPELKPSCAPEKSYVRRRALNRTFTSIRT